MSNVVVISGRISDYGPKLRYLESGKPELSLTLCCEEPGRDGRTFTLYVPVFVYGASCEALAETLEAHDVVLVTGKLGWTKKTTKDGEKSGLAVTTFGVEVLAQAPNRAHEPAPAYQSGLDESAVNLGPSGEPQREKPGKPRYPKHLRQAWQPEQAN